MATTTHSRVPALSRFGMLMALYAENFRRLQRVFALEQMPGPCCRSCIDDGLDLRLDVVERHPYTLELRLTYELVDPVSGNPDPSAFVRWYRDARLAEVTHCHVGRRWQDVLGLDADARTVVGHRLRMNLFLSKWLEYLGEQGHSPFTLRAEVGPSSPMPAAGRAAVVAGAAAVRAGTEYCR